MSTIPTYPPIVAVAVGNTRTRVGFASGKDIHDAQSVENSDATIVAATVARLSRGGESGPASAVVVASVNPTFSEPLIDAIRDAGGPEVARIGAEIPVLVPMALDDDSTVGQDRLLCALAAFRRAQQAVVVIDAGTAITVNFVDGEGTFQGGVIAPGLSTMLASLTEKAAALPRLAPQKFDPARGHFGKDTAHAMQLGVRNAALGLVRHTIELFAEAYQAYPQIVATGGDAILLFDGDEVVEHIVPDLQLLGIVEAWKDANADQLDGDD